MRSYTIPNFIHHTARRDSPQWLVMQRRTVIGSDGLRQAVFAKGRLEDRLHVRAVRLGHMLTAQ